MRNKFILLTDAQWQGIEKLILNQRKRKVCLRMVSNGIRWLNHIADSVLRLLRGHLQVKDLFHKGDVGRWNVHLLG